MRVARSRVSGMRWATGRESREQTNSAQTYAPAQDRVVPPVPGKILHCLSAVVGDEVVPMGRAVSVLAVRPYARSQPHSG